MDFNLGNFLNSVIGLSGAAPVAAAIGAPSAAAGLVSGGSKPATNQTKQTTTASASGSSSPPPSAASELTEKYKKTLEAVRAIQQKTVGTADELNLKDDYGDDVFYRIIYEEKEGLFRSYNFVLLPARETKLGSWNVPEVRAGLPLTATMKHKIMTVPGAGPIVQTIGIAGTTFNLIGALIGTEYLSDMYAIGPSASGGTPLSAVKTQPATAEIFRKFDLQKAAMARVEDMLTKLVYPGRSVTVEVKGAPNQSTFEEGKTKAKDFLRYTAIIKSARIHYVTVDRAYYNLELFITSYPKVNITPTSFYDKDTALPIDISNADDEGGGTLDIDTNTVKSKAPSPSTAAIDPNAKKLSADQVYSAYSAEISKIWTAGISPTDIPSYNQALEKTLLALNDPKSYSNKYKSKDNQIGKVYGKGDPGVLNKSKLFAEAVMAAVPSEEAANAILNPSAEVDKKSAAALRKQLEKLVYKGIEINQSRTNPIAQTLNATSVYMYVQLKKLDYSKTQINKYKLNSAAGDSWAVNKLTTLYPNVTTGTSY
jgi:hypothetical protein